VPGRLADIQEGSATRLTLRRAGRDTALLVVRRGDALFAYEDVCPHQFLPLTYRGGRVLSADGTRFRCSSHGAEFAVEDGRCLAGPCNGAGLTRVALTVEPDGNVRIAEE
jgi:nitrite reductase/ring-hydroxylating ferredoxin subunit